MARFREGAMTKHPSAIAIGLVSRLGLVLLLLLLSAAPAAAITFITGGSATGTNVATSPGSLSVTGLTWAAGKTVVVVVALKNTNVAVDPATGITDSGASTYM